VHQNGVPVRLKICNACTPEKVADVRHRGAALPLRRNGQTVYQVFQSTAIHFVAFGFFGVAVSRSFSYRCIISPSLFEHGLRLATASAKYRLLSASFPAQ
jgi:hypothetical protein